MFNVKIEKVNRVYSGKIGCMCGCKGKYTASSTFDQKGDQYPTPVNDRVVKMHFEKVMNFVGPIRPDTSDRSSYSTVHGYVGVQIDDRQYAVYFRK